MSYASVHIWLNRHYPRLGICEYCGRSDLRTEYASKNHALTKDINDYEELCHPCHMRKDALEGRFGASGSGGLGSTRRLELVGWQPWMTVASKKRKRIK